MEYSIRPFIVYKKGKKCGIMNAQKELIVPCTYEDLWISKLADGLIYCEAMLDDDSNEHGFSHYEFIFNEQGIMLLPNISTEFFVLKNGLIAIENPTNIWGCVNRQGELVIPCRYYDIQSTQNDNMMVRARNYKWGCIDHSGKTIIPCNYQSIQQTNKGFYVVQHAHKWYFRTQKNVKNEISYEKIEYLNPYWKAFYNGKWILLEDTGQRINTDEYDVIKDEKNGFLVVSQGAFTGLLHASTAQIVFPMEYLSESIHAFYGEQMTLRQEGKLGIIDKFKKCILPYQYDDIQRFQDIIIAQQNGFWTFWDKTGQSLLSSPFEAFSFCNTFIGVQQSDKWGLVNIAGQYIVKCQFDEVKYFETQYAQVRQGDKWGLIHLEDPDSTLCLYDEIYSFKENMSKVRIGLKYGFVNAQCELVIPVKYTDAADFKEGMARVARGKHIKYYGYVNLLGEEAVPLIYEDAYGFSGGLARVCYDNYGFVDKEGNVKIPFIYQEDYVGDFRCGIATVGLNKYTGKMGAVDTENQVVIPFIYDFIGDFGNNGCAYIEHQGLCFNIDRTGFVYYEPE